MNATGDKSMKTLKNAARALTAAAAASVLLAGAAQAQTYPSRPVKIVVPYAPGGPNDIVARLLAEKLTASTGQTFLVENKPGGGSNIGAEAVAKAPADGYTLLVAATSHSINMTLFPKENLKYDLLKDFAPVSLLMTGPLVLVTNPASPAKNVKEFVALAKAKSGKMSFGSSGNGASTHLAGEMLNSAAGLQTIHVPYKGSGPALTDLMGGQIDFMVDTMISAMPFVTSGKLRALATTGKTRSPALPDVPTLAEQGYPGFEAVAWIGLLAPAKTPPEVVAKLNAEVRKVLDQTEVRGRLSVQGFTAEWQKPDAFGDYMGREIQKWGAIVRKANVKVE
jgi:tripartite-type tricarboxylate transporter receptor subunit TctC